MPVYDVHLQTVSADPPFKYVSVTAADAAPAAGYTKVGEFEHEEVTHFDVLYHHVRDVMYEEGILDMAFVRITDLTDIVEDPPEIEE